jgi:hypothetical protein
MKEVSPDVFVGDVDDASAESLGQAGIQSVLSLIAGVCTSTTDAQCSQFTFAWARSF